MATCFLTNWVLVLFERLLFPLLQDRSRNYSLCQLIGHAGSQILSASAYFPVESGHPSDCFSAVDLGPQDPMVSVHIAQVSSMTFTCAMRAVFSLIYWTHVTHCMASCSTWPNPFTTWEPSTILPVLARGPPFDRIGKFCAILCFSLWPSAWGFPSLRGMHCDTWLPLIAYQKMSLFLDLTSRFASLRQHVVTMGQWSARFDRGSLLLHADHKLPLFRGYF